ncbi:MAG: M3 family metallopeptidase [Cephaloticoccus sp.]|nr:M3 family metallopeptidase [Cephaloticoccus sp.]MCF7761109.1 M3 family metallopeptidase [Cephaloticoccus sp.]
MQNNPFLEKSFQIAWSKLAPEHIEPAIAVVLTSAKQAIAAITAQDLGGVSYASTFAALENASEELNSAWGKVSHLQSVCDSPALRDAYNKMLPEVTAFSASIPLNVQLWQRLKAFAESESGKNEVGVRRRFMDETMGEFRQAGADLPDDKRKRLEALQGELAQLTQKYSENVLDATNGWELIVTDVTRLKGLPEHALKAAAKSAATKGKGTAESPAWRFTLHQPSLEPFMVYLEDDALRREMWEASSSVGSQAPHDNTELVRQILQLRAEEAALLGKANFADVVLERRMAKSGARALQFIEDLQHRAAGAFAADTEELEKFKAEQIGRAPAPLAPWEIAHWSEKLRQSKYAFDEEKLRPYFPMNRVIEGLFTLVGRVFGLVVEPRPVGEVEVWHPEVLFYELKNQAGVHLGSFYSDWYPRESKRGGAWMNYLRTGGPQPDGSRAPHLGLICGNMTPPAEGKPALLTHREVETVFHEFGHLLHHLLGEVEIKSLNGVNVAWDFVELPSQIMENWCWERESLDLFARHHETGEAIPEELFAKMIAAKNFRSATATMRQVSFAKMDLLMHIRTHDILATESIETTVRAAIKDCLVRTDPPTPTTTRRFNHIFSDPVGYAAGYYSYKWAEVLDADAFTRFQKEGIFNAGTGADFVRKILSRGNSADPMQLFRDFMGREPDLQALLIRSGLAV